MQPDSVRSGGFIFSLDREFPFGKNDSPISDTMSLLQTDPNTVHGFTSRNDDSSAKVKGEQSLIESTGGGFE